MIKQNSAPHFIKELHQQILYFYRRFGDLGAIEIFKMPVRTEIRNRKQKVDKKHTADTSSGPSN